MSHFEAKMHRIRFWCLSVCRLSLEMEVDTYRLFSVDRWRACCARLIDRWAHPVAPATRCRRCALSQTEFVSLVTQTRQHVRGGNSWTSVGAHARRRGILFPGGGAELCGKRLTKRTHLSRTIQRPRMRSRFLVGVWLSPSDGLSFVFEVACVEEQMMRWCTLYYCARRRSGMQKAWGVSHDRTVTIEDKNDISLLPRSLNCFTCCTL